MDDHICETCYIAIAGIIVNIAANSDGTWLIAHSNIEIITPGTIFGLMLDERLRLVGIFGVVADLEASHESGVIKFVPSGSLPPMHTPSPGSLDDSLTWLKPGCDLAHRPSEPLQPGAGAATAG